MTADHQKDALFLMRQALTSLRAAGQTASLLHLGKAIEAAEKPASQADSDAIADPDIASIDQTILRAVGGAIAVIGTLLDRAGAVRISELAEAMSIFAVVTAERDEREGLYLGGWAALLDELAGSARADAPVEF